MNSQQLEALHAQMEAQSQQLQSLLTWSGVGSPSPPPQSLSGIMLHKLAAEDDPQSFLAMFESTAAACGWPAAEWAVRLLPLLSGEAQIAALGLPASTRGNFQAVKKVVQGERASPPRITIVGSEPSS